MTVDALGELPPLCDRSPHWRALEQEHLEEFPTCENCGSDKNCIVHHKRPVHLFPDLELVDKNLKTLCENPSHNCHLIQGHLLSWKSYNASVDKDAAAFLEKVKTRP